ncbi:hypothetical protein PG990_001096 [Apiospora arundinis]
MDIDKDTIISAESFDKFGVDERRQTSFDRVQAFVDRGLMTKDAVLERFTERLALHAPALPNIKNAFQQLKDDHTEYLSNAKLRDSVNNVVASIGPWQSSDIVGLLLFDILSWHATFPFPSASESGIHDAIDESSFVRAVCLLLLDNLPGYGPKRLGKTFHENPKHRIYSGELGPHDGFLVANRGKGANDFMRRIFRSLAVVIDETAAAAKAMREETTISVPRFSMFRPLSPEEMEDEERFPDGRHVVIVENEREITVDVQDVVSDCPPGEDRKTANPLRESYSLALPALPHAEHDLSELWVPSLKVAALLTLCKNLGVPESPPSAGRRSSTDLMALIEKLSAGTNLGWEDFRTTLRGYEELIANALAKTAGLLIRRCDMGRASA